MKHIKKIIKSPRFRLRDNIILFQLAIAFLGALLINSILYFGLHVLLNKSGWDEALLAQLDNHLVTLGSISAFITVAVIMILIMVLTRSLGKTVSILSSHMEDMARGKWSTRIQIDRNDEFGQFASGFNYMAQHIEDSLQKIQSAKEYADNIFLSAPSILIVLSNRMRTLSVNNAFDQLKEEVPSFEPVLFIDALEQEISDNLQSGNTVKKEISILSQDTGTDLFFSVTVSRLGNSSSHRVEEAASVLLTISDITHQKQMADMVNQTRQDWQDTFDSIPDIITIHDSDMNIIQANKAAKQELGLPDLLPSKNIKCFRHYHGSNRIMHDCPSKMCQSSGSPVLMETFEPHLSKYLEVRTIPRINDKSETVGIIHIARDISERKEIENEHNLLFASVAKAKIEWEETFDTVYEFVILIDKEFNIKRCNNSFAHHLETSNDALINEKCFDYFSPFDNKDLTHCKELIVKELPLTRFEFRTADDHWFYLSHRPIYDRGGLYLHTVLIITNITDLKEAQHRVGESEEELKKKVNELEKFYDMAVGRELKMKQLKKEIKRLEQRYEVHSGKDPA